MSIPHPEVQIGMMQEMMRRDYKFNLNDKVKINDNFKNKTGNEEFRKKIYTIWFPYYYLQSDSWTNELMQAYILKETPTPFTEGELILVEASGKTREDTIKYLEEQIEISKNDTTWVPA